MRKFGSVFVVVCLIFVSFNIPENGGGITSNIKIVVLRNTKVFEIMEMT